MVPFDEVKQTALLTVINRLLPRVAAGIGPYFTQHPRVQEHAGNSTARVTLIMLSTDKPCFFAQVSRSFNRRACAKQRGISFSIMLRLFVGLWANQVLFSFLLLVRAANHRWLFPYLRSENVGVSVDHLVRSILPSSLIRQAHSSGQRQSALT